MATRKESSKEAPVPEGKGRRKRRLPSEAIARLLSEVELARDKPAARLVADMLATVVKLARDEPAIADLKLLNAALKEMRLAMKIFAPYRGVRKVSTFGSARTPEGDPVYEQAREFARQMARAGFMIITGAGDGIMRACQEGAGRANSFGINIRLPFEQRANEFIDNDRKLLSFKYFFTRKLFFVKEADAVALFPGGFGTNDEGFEVLTLVQTGKTKPIPIVLIDSPTGTYWKTWKRYVEDHLLRRALISEEDMHLFRLTASVSEAVEEITTFYRVYHSCRYVEDNLVMRLNRPLGAAALNDLNRRFSDLLTGGRIEQRGALAQEDEAEIAHLPRLVIPFNRFNFGRLRQLIDEVNRTTVSSCEG